MLLGMRTPKHNRAFTNGEANALQEGLRSANACVLRHCQILLASARGQHAREIAALLGCDDQTVRHEIHVFNRWGLAALRRRSSAPHPIPHAVFDSARCEQLRTMLHQNPRTFGRPTSVWTLRLAADIAYAEGIIAHPVSGETIRHAVAALKTRWKGAQHWITSPNPAYARKKNSTTGASG
jgi:hypothetical protein